MTNKNKEFRTYGKGSMEELANKIKQKAKNQERKKDKDE